MSDERKNLSGPTGAPWQLALDRESSIFPDFMDGSPDQDPFPFLSLSLTGSTPRAFLSEPT
jgi:hypothetical protein